MKTLIILALLAVSLDSLVIEVNNNHKGYEIDAYEYCTIIDKSHKECEEVVR